MRCKKHYTDLSSTAGVCASCLRERLLSLIAAQEQVQPQIQNLDGKHRNPAFNSRNSDHSDRRGLSDQLFYTTPHREPTAGGHNKPKKKRSLIRLISFPNIFRSRNRKPFDSDSVTDPRAPNSALKQSRGGHNATSSSSWFSSIISGGRHRQNPTICNDESTITAGTVPVRDRGMSPVRNPNILGGDEGELRNATESTESWKNTPRRTPARRGGSGGHMRNISGLNFCLTPLVRASPNLQWNPKGLAPDVVLPGEVGGPVRPQLSYAKSFCANRSRKLADFGMNNLNR